MYYNEIVVRWQLKGDASDVFGQYVVPYSNSASNAISGPGKWYVGFDKGAETYGIFIGPYVRFKQLYDRLDANSLRTK